MLMWCNMVQSLVFDPLILSWLNAYAWFEEAGHVIFLKLIEHLRLIWESGARDVLEVDWTPTLDLRKWNKWCSQSWLNAYAWLWGSIAHDVIKVDWTPTLDLKKRSTYMMFLKLMSWKKNLYLQRNLNLWGWSTSEVTESSSSWENSH